MNVGLRHVSGRCLYVWSCISTEMVYDPRGRGGIFVVHTMAWAVVLVGTGLLVPVHVFTVM